jgi:hypothetical protein
MNLINFIAQLQVLADAGHGTKQVYYRHGASGDCGLLASAHITDRVEDTGPFDLEPNEEYVSIYAGN